MPLVSPQPQKSKTVLVVALFILVVSVAFQNCSPYSPVASEDETNKSQQAANETLPDPSFAVPASPLTPGPGGAMPPLECVESGSIQKIDWPYDSAAFVLITTVPARTTLSIRITAERLKAMMAPSVGFRFSGDGGPVGYISQCPGDVSGAVPASLYAVSGKVCKESSQYTYFEREVAIQHALDESTPEYKNACALIPAPTYFLNLPNRRDTPAGVQLKFLPLGFN